MWWRRPPPISQPGVAITDHGVMYGVVDFYKAAKKAGVNPIIGIEAYVVDGSRFDRPRGSENVRYHMTLLADQQIGYRNLMKLSSQAYLDGYYYKPRMDSELLAAHSEGIVATSGCLGGPVAKRLAPDATRMKMDEVGARTSKVPSKPPRTIRTSSVGELLHRDPGPRDRGSATDHA